MSPVPVSQQNWHPATLADRGVAMPFTTPRLSGARARLSERGLDLIVPNPSGARGVYILHAESLSEYCTPTMHDARLVDHALRRHTLAPRIVREAARQVAVEGLAGRSARAAASAAERRAHNDQTMISEALVRLLVDGDRYALDLPPPARDPAFDQLARECVKRVAASLERPGDALTTDLESLSRLFVGIGLSASHEQARCPALIEEIGNAAAAIRAWSLANPSAPRTASVFVSNAGRVLPLAREAIAEARARLSDLPSLLRRIAMRGEDLAIEIERADWLLDGWDTVCMLWRLAEDDAGRMDALADMAPALPVLPLEVSGGLETVSGENVGHCGSAVLSVRRWRLSGGFELVARNERLRTLLAA